MMTGNTETALKIGGAMMAVGVVAAVTAGVVNSQNSTKSKMKKIAKKTVKVMDNFMDEAKDMLK